MEQQDPAPSIRRVALDAGLTYETVHRIYHNKAKGIDLSTLDALASALGCEPGELIGRPGRRSSRGR
jgi:DNA-binding Xre family transcriptional regulator